MRAGGPRDRPHFHVMTACPSKGAGPAVKQAGGLHHATARKLIGRPAESCARRAKSPDRRTLLLTTPIQKVLPLQLPAHSLLAHVQTIGMEVSAPPQTPLCLMVYSVAKSCAAEPTVPTKQIEANAARTGNARVRSTLGRTARQARRRASAPMLNQGLNSVAHFCPSVTPQRRPSAPPRRHAPAAPRVPLAAPRQDRKPLRMLPMQYGAPCMPGTIRREHPAHWPSSNQQRQKCSTRPEPAARWAPNILEALTFG